MTEPKKEKCEACCGSGYINFWTDDGHISMRTCRRCDGYGYIKAKPMANEEYMQTCSSDELANTIFRLIVHGTVIRPDREYIKKWLKEKHND